MRPFLPLLVAPLVAMATSLELLSNGNMENTHLHGNWYAVDCRVTPSRDKHSGRHSIRVSNRHHDWSGVSQNVSVRQGQHYVFKGFIKLQTMKPGNLFEEVTVTLDIEDNMGQHHYPMLGKNTRVTSGGWHVIGGDVHVDHAVKNARLYLGITHSPEVNYLLDDCSLQPLTLAPSRFSEDADTRIEQIRSAPIQVTLDGDIHPTNLEVQITQTKSDFAWGTALSVPAFNDPSQNAYRQFLYDNFEWAVFGNALKWYATEKKKGHVSYDEPMKAWNTLHQHGITVRGHNVVWAVDQFVPGWQKNLTGSDLRNAVDRRVQSVVGTFKGKLAHWDVNNENLHGDFYASHLQDDHFTQRLFRQVHGIDPRVKLFLNDYNLVSSSEMTMAMVDQAVQLKNRGVAVYGIGIQSHLRPPINTSFIQYRLDELATAGLPLWVTELDIEEPDENKKAQYYEDVLRIYFAHPKVEGVIFWGFSDQHHWRPKAALTTGVNMTANAAGQRVHHLLRELWRTDETRTLLPDQPISVRGFKGQYQLLVKHQGKVIRRQNFHNGDRGFKVTVKLGGDENTPHVSHLVVG